MRHLRRGREGDATSRGVESGYCTARLQRYRRLATRRERKLDYSVCRREGGIDFGGFETRVDHRVLRGRVMNQRRTGCQRLIERHDRCLGGELDSHLFGEVFGLSGGVADDRSDRLTDIGHALMREDRLGYRDIIGAIETREDRFHIAEKGRGYDRDFWRRVHDEDAPTCDRAAQEPQYAGALSEIGGVAAASSQ